MFGKLIALSAGLVLGVIAGHTVADRPTPEPTALAAAPSPPAPRDPSDWRCMLDAVAMDVTVRRDRLDIRTGEAKMSLPRNETLSDDKIYVAAVFSGGKSVTLTLDINAHATLTMITADGYERAEGDCQPI